VWRNIKEEFKTYLGRVFEDICIEVLVEMTKKKLLPIHIENIGKWWWKETEIDIVGIETKSKKALALEAKMAELNYQEAKKLLSELSIKAKQIRNVKDCILGVMAKKIVDKEKIREEGFLAFDLEDMTKIRKQN
jgi:AAA+ ATPase superfamily predicted ATPase